MGHRPARSVLAENEARGVVDLHHETPSDFQDLFIERRVDAESRRKGPVAHGIGSVLVEQVHGRDHVALAL